MSRLIIFPNISFSTRVYYLWVVIFLPILIGSCALYPPKANITPTINLEGEFIDRSLLTGMPCKAPCWYGIEPGISTREEALSIIQNLSFIDSSDYSEMDIGYIDTTRQENIPARFMRLECKQPEDRSCAGLVLVDDIVMGINLFPNYPLTFSEVVEALGSPEFVQVSPFHPEAPKYCNVALIWIQRQVIVDFRAYNQREKQVFCSDFQENGKIDSDLPVDQVSYVTQADTRVTEPYEPKGYYPWSGFDKP